MRQHQLFGVRIDDLSTDELRRCVSDWLRSSSAHVIVTPNPEFLLLVRHDDSFRSMLNRSDLSLPDGVGLRFAVPAITGNLLAHRHTGVDSLLLIARECAATGMRLALFGGDQGVSERAAQNLRAQISGLQVEGIDPGHIRLEQIQDLSVSVLSGFHVVAVGLGMKKQERVMEFLRDRAASNLPSLRVLIGTGGAFDMISHSKRRAPIHVRHIGLEWLWRLLIEPRRFRRIFRAFPVFPAIVIWDTLRHRRFIRACRASVPEIFRQLRGL
ncbi:hypothetical protein A2348_02525 [Candidatus Uhrbacteria bacterium RIFOXYB12_FULL_58_10]|uniref:Glycosyltransferase n=1 Tax=Candidatus Uhrbacteria bacterium RIFOXYB2_FULL_57_15 TaxID=1802422 RepID=A0A1F7W6U2_9BACT|nr:MAG: hypothetical protein A2348_02525 [Candidatus Uhrbacteria bacterium RIFOXYB12_FULL_58_10]OGL98512.1 MAG: hypothetical protein A2304_02365 [Candidatus Uhrbacteria bacterium RIFOXYB2_FULL_57_15]OGL99173.1 MAG: hypothetical protein A2501_03170 [Candidatus Uhrbacteria bacterium RIFOXYC12_FULL_57_11]